MKKIVKTENAPQAIGPYNQAIIFKDLIFLSGQIALTKNGELISDNIEEQTLQCLNNIEEILKSVNSGKEKIIKTTIYLKDLNNFQKVNEIYSNFFKDTIFPARTTIEVTNLPKNSQIEIEAIAYL